MNVTEEQGSSKDEELSVDTSNWSISMLQIPKVLFDLHLLYVTIMFLSLNGSHYAFPPTPLTSTWPHLRCDVGPEEEEY